MSNWLTPVVCLAVFLAIMALAFRAVLRAPKPRVPAGRRRGRTGGAGHDSNPLGPNWTPDNSPSSSYTGGADYTPGGTDPGGHHSHHHGGHHHSHHDSGSSPSSSSSYDPGSSSSYDSGSSSSPSDSGSSSYDSGSSSSYDSGSSWSSSD